MDNTISRRQLALRSAAFTGGALLSAQSTGTPALGFMGVGARSRAHFNAYKKIPETKVAALCDIESARAEAVNATLPQKATVYTDYRELIRDKNVQAVVIATPNYLHHEMALAALQAGKDLLLEKPIGINYQQAKEIRAEAQRNGRILVIGMQRLYGTDRELLDRVEQGAIGNLRLITAGEYRGDWNPRGAVYKDAATGKAANWRFMKKAVGSSELEFSVHLYATLSRLINSPLVRLSATGGALYYPNREIRDGSSTIVEYKNGVRLSHTYGMFAPQKAVLIILGDKGSLRREDGKVTVFGQDGTPKNLPPLDLPKEEDVVFMYREFYDSIRTRKPPRTTGPDLAIEAAKIAYGLDLSIGENRIVTDKDFS